MRETFRYAAYFRIANKTVAEKDKIVGMTSYDVDYDDMMMMMSIMMMIMMMIEDDDDRG